jgi:GNAT superfamily N-acetyltransferase
VATVRLAGPGDLDALHKIAAGAYRHYVARIGRAPAPMTVGYARAVRARQAWVAVEDGEIAGFVILIEKPGYLLLENVAVRPAAQGRGISSRLLGLAEDHARSLGLGVNFAEITLVCCHSRGNSTGRNLSPGAASTSPTPPPRRP